ncbi:MAG: hypothetical protein A3H98_14690 [Bacteroidetes bacterium RIFCSPLOWO2_02_FULL_36_8]|nr:MAG: hypothetical protein A3H98_14690 [Bacteroidetes bacterium RIFCSPLOWO2_02_FULL_36_8]
MLMLAVAGVTLINSCGGDDTTTPTPENSPTLTVKPSTDQTVDPGSTLTFTWDARKHPDGKKLTTFSITQDNAALGVASKKYTTWPATLKSADESQYLDTLAITVPASGGPYTYKFTVNTEDSKSASASVKVTLNSTTPLATTRTGQFWHIQGACKGAFDLVTGVSKGSADPETDKDMKNTDAVLPATFTGTWTAGNSTMYVKDNAYNYAGANVEGATTKYAAGTPSATVSSPAVGDIYIAKLRGGADYAVIKILTNDATVGFCADGTTPTTNKGKVTFEYKTK